MSAEFHENYSGYMWQILRDVKDDRPITNEPIADAIRSLYLALAPVEYAIALREAGDADNTKVILDCYRNSDNLKEALDVLLECVKNNEITVDEIAKRVPKWD